MSTQRLTTTSYVVLGLIEQLQPATTYDVKQLAALSTANFWALPHTQLYTETARLADAGLLSEEREDGGRRRRFYRLTDSGRAALDAWRERPVDEPQRIFEPSVLKLAFGADPAMLAERQIETHERQLAGYEELAAALDAAPDDWPRGMRLALQVGIDMERQFLRTWRELARRPPAR